MRDVCSLLESGAADEDDWCGDRPTTASRNPKCNSQHDAEFSGVRIDDISGLRNGIANSDDTFVRFFVGTFHEDDPYVNRHEQSPFSVVTLPAYRNRKSARKFQE